MHEHDSCEIVENFSNDMEHAKDDFDVNDYVRRMRKNKKRKKMERKEQLRKTKVDGIMMRWNNLRYKCPKSERERDVFDKFGHTYQNREQNNEYI
ncbi:hypothetical protein S245_002475, partial [Arachis hypogaea]